MQSSLVWLPSFAMRSSGDDVFTVFHRVDATFTKEHKNTCFRVASQNSGKSVPDYPPPSFQSNNDLLSVLVTVFVSGTMPSVESQLELREIRVCLGVY